MLKQVLALVAASGLAAKLVQHLSHDYRVRRSRDEGHRHRDDVNRWEAEGGNLPSAPSTAQAAARRRRAPRKAATAG